VPPLILVNSSHSQIFIMDFSVLKYLHLSLNFLGLDNLPGFEVGGYLDSMLNNIPASYFLSVATSFILVAVAYFWKPNYTQESSSISHEEVVSEKASEGIKEAINDEEKESDIDSVVLNSFEISASDEVEFVPLVSEEEDRRIGAEIAPKSKYMELNQDNPSAHLNMYLDMSRGKGDGNSDEDDDDVDEDDFEIQEISREDIGRYVTDKDLHVLDDPRESPSRRGSVMARVKKARQRAIRNAVEKNMTADDRMKETMATNQMLAKVYSLMRENQEMFGDTSFDEVKSLHLDLYKA